MGEGGRWSRDPRWTEAALVQVEVTCTLVVDRGRRPGRRGSGGRLDRTCRCFSWSGEGKGRLRMQRTCWCFVLSSRVEDGALCREEKSKGKGLWCVKVGNRNPFQTFFFVGLFRATPTAHGGSQARGPVGATAASLHHSSRQLDPQPTERSQGANPHPRGC